LFDVVYGVVETSFAGSNQSFDLQDKGYLFDQNWNVNELQRTDEEANPDTEMSITNVL